MPSFLQNPDWYESTLAVVLATLSIIGWLIKAYIINPIVSTSKETHKDLQEIKSDVAASASEIKSIRIGMETMNGRVDEAHHSIADLRSRVARMEDKMLK